MRNRNDYLATAMIEPGERQIGGIKLRPFSYGSMQLAYLFKLSLFTGEGDTEQTDEEKQRQIVTFAWMQSAPIDEVVAAVHDGSAGNPRAQVFTRHHLRHDPRADGRDQPHRRNGFSLQRSGGKQISVQRGRRAGKVLNPGWLASAVYTIAKDTGWREEFIIWKLPMARALQYYHCSLQSANLWTLEPPTEESIQALAPDELIGLIDRMTDEDE